MTPVSGDPQWPGSHPGDCADRDSAPQQMRWNQPPGWPSVPEGWSPPAGWQPDPSWPTPPYAWPLWVPQQGGGPQAANGETPVLPLTTNGVADTDGGSMPPGENRAGSPMQESGAAGHARRWLFPALAIAFLMILIGTGTWLLSSGEGHAVKTASRASSTQPATTSAPSPSPSPTASPTVSSAPLDWRNRSFTLAGQTCLAGTTKTVALVNGTGTGQSVTVTVFKTINGDFNGDGTQEVAVLLGCNGGGSGSGSEVQVFTSDGKLLQRLLPPAAADPGAGFPPQFDPYGMLAATAGTTPGSVFTTGVHSWAAGDAHCCPSQDVVYRWNWSGTAFVSAFDHVVTPTAAPTTQSVPVPIPQPVTISCDNVTPIPNSDSGYFQILATNADCATADGLAVDGVSGPITVSGYNFACTIQDGPTNGLASTLHSCRDPYGRVVTWTAT
jgi:hypothetical protein